MIQFDHVTKQFVGGQIGLDDVSFKMPAGAMAFLTGRSGSGKSTLLRLIMALSRPTQGRVHVGGVDVASMKKRHITMLRRSIGVVFQNHRLLYDRSVFSNVSLPLEILGYSPQDTEHRVRSALERVGLANKARARPDQLSTGEQQRVGIARALIHRPRLVLADEPTGNLDPLLSQEVFGLFSNFNQSARVTVLIASHDLSLIKRMGLPMIVLNNGKITYNDF